MSSWIGQAVRRGIVTTDYPARPATDEELPLTARSPALEGPSEALSTAVAACPVGAIAPAGIDQGRCIRCARCLPLGFRFGGPAEASTGRRAELQRPPPGPGEIAPVPAPLAALGRSVHLFLVDVGSCNACNREVFGLSNPFYDSQRVGVFLTNSPRHADALVVVGVPAEEMVEPLRRAYEALPAPKVVIAVGACPISGGAFRGNPGLRGSLEEVVPVDVFVPGCPPTPVQILDALLATVGRRRREG